MKHRPLYFSVFLIFFISCKNTENKNIALELKKENNSIYINSEWVNWATSIKDSSVKSTQISATASELLTALSNTISSYSQFNLPDYIDTSYHQNAFIESYKENLDDDSEKEYLLLIGGLSEKCLLLVLNTVNDKLCIADFITVSSYNGKPTIHNHNNGGYKLVELISRGGGSTDYRRDAHYLYKFTDSKIYKVLEGYDGIDISGTLKVKTDLTMQMWDTTLKEDAVLLHYKVNFWICNNYNFKKNATSEDNWDLYKSQSCDPSVGIVLLNDEYGLLCRWSNDSLKYLPDYSRGISAEKKEMIENINADEEYAKKFFNVFKEEIFRQNEQRNNTIHFLEEQFHSAKNSLNN
jgi:hypothetical protein